MKHLPREHQRAYITFYLRIFDKDKFIGFVIDIAAGGLKIISDFVLQEGASYTFQMKLPSSLEWEGKSDKIKFIEFSADCLWSKKDTTNDDFFISGFHFSNLDDEDNKIIHAMIKQYKIP